MAYKQKSNGLPFKQMGSTPTKQTRKQPTYEGTDEYREEEDIPKNEFDFQRVKKGELKDLRSNDKNIDLDKGGFEPVKNSGFGPRVDGSGQKESTKKKKPFSKKVMKDGKKVDAIHKGKVVKGNFQPHQFRD
jgi:hypothetical protein